MSYLYGNGLIKKEFKNYSEARYYKKLYNSFPNHAKALLKKSDNTLYYKYIPWKEWNDLIHKWYFDNIHRCRFLWNSLWKLHFKNCKIISWYENVCLKRDYVSSDSIFCKSCMYEWIIHWDLHLRNIIVNDSWMFFIDRLKERWDIMFDFSFIMSFLWFRFDTKNKKYIDYIINFFNTYVKYIKWSKKDFFVSFRNNFINYWIVCSSIAEQRSDFPEWKYWKNISKHLINEYDFISFILRCYQWLI